jgi:hypothetical protein
MLQPKPKEPVVNAKYIHQVELERLFNKNQTVSRIRGEFERTKEIDFSSHMTKHNIDPEFGYDLLTQMVLHKRTTVSTMVGILKHHYERWPDACQLAADAILRCVKADLVDYDTTIRQLIIVFDITEDVQEDLDRYQFPLPMVVCPEKVTNNRETGYFLSTNSIILRKNHHEDDVCLDHINTVNRMKFSVNYDTAHMIKNQWRNLDRCKPGESKLDFNKRVRAFEKYDRTAKQVIDQLLVYGNEFYLTHKYDKRGRIYCQGYHVNYQGAPWNKATVELFDKEVVPL